MSVNSSSRATFLTLAVWTLQALAEPPASENIIADEVQVVVMRGASVQAGSERRNATGGAQESNAVVIIRPPPGSFMRETTRLANAAEARELEAALDEARAANHLLSEALQAIRDAARAAESQSSGNRELVLVPVDRKHGPRRSNRSGPHPGGAHIRPNNSNNK